MFSLSRSEFCSGTGVSSRFLLRKKKCGKLKFKSASTSVESALFFAGLFQACYYSSSSYSFFLYVSPITAINKNAEPINTPNTPLKSIILTSFKKEK
ncbi:MAG TPA: hypothetical protein DCX32_02540 [Candidatus Moranbacteria bacterium]|nr:hypothetical protein [Candidatus Moranbacteria bacterium]